MIRSIAVLSFALFVTQHVYADRCESIFRSNGIQSNLALQSSKLDFAPSLGVIRGARGPSEVNNFWVQQVAAIKTEKDALALTNDLFQGVSLMSSGQWKMVAGEALPLILKRSEALDAIGALDITSVYEVIRKQVDRFSGFTDSEYSDVLHYHVFEPRGMYSYPAESLANFMSGLKNRQSVKYDFQRRYDGAAAERIYRAFDVPVRHTNGVDYKVLRTNDRSIVVDMAYDAKSDDYLVNISADIASPNFKNHDPKFFKLELANSGWADRKINTDSSGETFGRLMKSAATVSGYRYDEMKYVLSAKADDGTDLVNFIFDRMNLAIFTVEVSKISTAEAQSQQLQENLAQKNRSALRQEAGANDKRFRMKPETFGW